MRLAHFNKACSYFKTDPLAKLCVTGFDLNLGELSPNLFLLNHTSRDLLFCFEYLKLPHIILIKLNSPLICKPNRSDNQLKENLPS